MFYPEYIRYQEAGGLFLMTNDYLQGYLLAPTGWNSLITNFLSQFYHSLSLGLFIGNRFTFNYRSHPPPLLKAMESSTARMDNHRTDHHVLHLSICLELIRTITIQSIPFDTRFYLFIQNKVIRYTSALIAIPFLYLLLPENCLLLLYLYGIVFERIFFKQKASLCYRL